MFAVQCSQSQRILVEKDTQHLLDVSKLLVVGVEYLISRMGDTSLDGVGIAASHFASCGKHFLGKGLFLLDELVAGLEKSQNLLESLAASASLVVLGLDLLATFGLFRRHVFHRSERLAHFVLLACSAASESTLAQVGVLFPHLFQCGLDPVDFNVDSNMRTADQVGERVQMLQVFSDGIEINEKVGVDYKSG